MENPPVLPHGVLTQIHEYLGGVLSNKAQEHLLLHPPSDEWLTFHVELNDNSDRCSFDAWAEDRDEMRLIFGRKFNAYAPMEFSGHLMGVLDAMVAGTLVIIETHKRHMIISDGANYWNHHLEPVGPPQELVAVSSFLAWND